MRTICWAAALAVSLAAGPAAAAEGGQSDGGAQEDTHLSAETLVNKGGAQDGRPRLIACKTCHKADGSGMAAARYPRLAGQSEEYLLKQMEDFAAGDRENATMAPIAERMSETEMKRVSAYYANQSAPVKGSDAAEEVLAQGERIASMGIGEENVPACTSCHGPQGKGVPPVFPGIAGQHASYIEKQINDWKAGKRANDPAQMMAEIAPKLSEDQIKAVAAYFSNVEAAGGH